MSLEDRNLFISIWSFYTTVLPRSGKKFLKFHRCELEAKDISDLLAAGLIERAHAVNGTVITFKVEEALKLRCRWVVFPKEINMEYPLDVKIPLEFIGDVVNNSKFSYAATADIVSCFHHFPLPVEARSYFVFFFDDVPYQITTIPTGGRHPPLIAQLATKTLALGPVQEMQHVTVYVDNVRFGGEDLPTVRNAMRWFLHRASQCHFKVNVELNGGTIYDFLGIHFEHLHNQDERLQVNLASKFITKTQNTGLNPTPSLREVVALFSRLMYGSVILGVRTHKFYVVFKFLRRRIGWPLDDDCRIWTTAATAIEDWRIEVLRNSPRCVVSAPQAYSVVFSDASLTGWGAVAFRSDGRSLVVAGRWPPSLVNDSINVLELRAVVNALDSLDTDFYVLLYVDNTTALYNVSKGRSRNFTANNLVGHLDTSRILGVFYVSSENNPADGPSRYFAQAP